MTGLVSNRGIVPTNDVYNRQNQKAFSVNDQPQVLVVGLTQVPLPAALFGLRPAADFRFLWCPVAELGLRWLPRSR